MPEQYVTVVPTWMGDHWKKGDVAPLSAFGERGRLLMLTGELRPATPAEEAKALASGTTYPAPAEPPVTDADRACQLAERLGHHLEAAREALADLQRTARRVAAAPGRPGAPGWVPADLAAEQARTIADLQKRLADRLPDVPVTPAGDGPARHRKARPSAPAAAAPTA